MTLLRPLLMLAVVVGACFTSMKYSEHHSGTNDGAFELLYMHLIPAPLVVPHASDEQHASADEETPSQAQEHAAERLVSISLPLPAAMDGDPNKAGSQLVLFNLQIFQIAAVLLVLLAFTGVPAFLKTGRGDALTRVLAGWCMWIRDEMVVPNMGKENGYKFLPFFLSIFFFIVFMNLMGLVPGSVTPTASIFVTAALALVTLIAMLGCGMAVQGPVAYFKNLVPHVPGWMWPLMFLVELMGVLVKPFALMIRLFANLTGGHMVVLSFMALIFFFAGNDFSATGYAVSPIAIGFAVFIMIIEAFVALLQAYIFTQLSIIFVGGSIHPEH